MDEIRIPNQATYSPIALTDVAIGANHSHYSRFAAFVFTPGSSAIFTQT